MGYKTADELEISNEEYNALCTVRDRLLNGTYGHVDIPEGESAHFVARTLEAGKKAFNMGVGMAHAGRQCGQIGCIGGWMGIELGMSPDDANNYVSDREGHEYLGGLFFPNHIHPAAWTVLDDRAAGIAIESFLQSGDGKEAWQVAVAEAHLRAKIAAKIKKLTEED